MDKYFSGRYGYHPSDKEITIREDAPRGLREAILIIAKELGMKPKDMRSVICRILRRMPDDNNWSDYPNVWSEVQDLTFRCNWYKVYDITEAFYDNLTPQQIRTIDLSLGTEVTTTPIDLHKSFESQLNDYFIENGIGWQMIDGRIQTRGSEVFETTVKSAMLALDAASRLTAKSELHEALQDLSRRPEPDITGAIQHSMASFECVVRDVCGDPKQTLGGLLKHPELHNIPKPLDSAIEKCWGFASERARHIQEGRIPERREAELIVGIVASLATYLSKKDT